MEEILKEQTEQPSTDEQTFAAEDRKIADLHAEPVIANDTPGMETSTEEAILTEDDTPIPQSNDDMALIKEKIIHIDLNIDAMSNAYQRATRDIREMHKLYHNEFAGRLKSMQDELEQYRKVDKGRAFDGILGEIARIYSNNETLADEMTDEKVKKSVRYLLLDLADLLESYGVSMLKSNPGDKRNTRHCQVLERVLTDDPKKHDTIAASHSTGFYIDNRTIIKEIVDVYIYIKPAETSQDTVPEISKKEIGAETAKTKEE